ncbi:MAG: DNA repair protein RecO [Acidobacteriota bacterium]
MTLRTYPYAESNKIAVFLTREFGKVRGIAHGARKPKSRFGSSLEPLTHVRLSFYRKEHQELAVLQNCEIIRAFPAYALTLEVNLHFSYFSELLLEFTREQQESGYVFRLALAVLDVCRQVRIELLARYLELWLLKLEGVLPDLEQKLPPQLAAKARAMLKLPPDQLSGDELSEAEIKRLERWSEELIEYHLEKKLKSRKMLKELL